jgi:sarcosine oxidase subunit gamma
VPPPIDPTNFARRSFVYRLLAGQGAEFAEISGGAVAMRFGASLEDEVAAARSLGLADLSPLPRIGFKGAGALQWLGGQGVAGLDRDNRAAHQDGGEIAVRLGPNEALILSAVAGQGGLCRSLENAWAGEDPARCHAVWRGDSHFWSAVSGSHAAAMLAKLCAIDLRPRRFARGEVAQTSVARLGAVIVRADLGPVPVFHILGDSASAEYFWQALIDAMAEFDGRLVGLAALRELAGAIYSAA